MSLYLAQSNLALDPEFHRRVSACVTNETSLWEAKPIKSVSQIVVEILPYVASAPGFSNKYLWGDQAANLLPGNDAITDAEILGAVQPLLEAYRPSVVPVAE